MASSVFPHEIWWLLLSRLDVRSICRGRASFRLWLAITRKDAFWKQYALSRDLALQYKPPSVDHEWFCRAHLICSSQLRDGRGIGKMGMYCGELVERNEASLMLVYWDTSCRVPRYVGQIRNGLPHGSCQAYSKSGFLEFSGTYAKGLRAYGRSYYEKCADRYEGEWRDGRRHGLGTYSWENGDLYVGDWVQGVLSGYGVYKWNDGRIYSGRWWDHNQEGNGTLVWPDGSVYGGDWRHGCRQGTGTMTWPRPPYRWEGTWNADLRVTEDGSSVDASPGNPLWDGFFRLDFVHQRKLIEERRERKRKLEQE